MAGSCWVAQARPALLLAATLWAGLLSAPCLADIAQGEDTSIQNLAWRDGMVIFNGALRKAIPPNATSAADPAAVAVPCGCSDVAPRDTSGGTPPFLVSTDCFFLAQYGNCNASFMQVAVSNAESYLTELVFSDGFCQISCGRCACCSEPTVVLQKLGAARFLQALKVAQPSLLDLLSFPGYTGTVLVPTDAAFDAALAQYPALLRDPALLQQVLKFHMLPPEPRTKGMWTTPFMAVGARLWTAADVSTPIQAARAPGPLPPGTTAYGGLTGLRLQGPVNGATVVGPSDVMACKAYLTVIDAVLLPFDPAALGGTGGGAGLGAALAGGQCTLQANAFLNASVLLLGDSNRQHTVGDCCASCQRAPGCNAFQYCSQKGGCRLGDGTLIKFGSCQLVRDANVTAGQPPAWAGWSGATPLVSGYVNAAAVAVPAGVVAASGPAAGAGVGRRLAQRWA